MSKNGNRPGEGAAHSVGELSNAPEFTRQPASRQAARQKVAAFILAECAKLDLRVGIDGCDLILAPPKGMPQASWLSFRRAILEYPDEIIDHILGEATL